VPTTLTRPAAHAVPLGYGRAALNHPAPLSVVATDPVADAEFALTQLAFAPTAARPRPAAELVTTDRLVSELLQLHATRESDEAYILPM
jgi:hypothetical protein